MEVRVGPGLVHIVDDNATFRKTIEGCLQQFGYEVDSYPSAQHLLDRLPNESIPSCLLLDVRLPGMSGPELQQRLIELGSTLPIVFLSGYPDIPITVRTMKAGAENFLLKPVSSDQLVQTVERAIARHKDVLGLKQMRDTVLSRIAKLTPRERQVFELVIRGKSNKAVANALGSTERTIKAHRHKVMEKMQFRSLAELVSFAERSGVLDASLSGPSPSMETTQIAGKLAKGEDTA
ncbi:response regulator [Bradyrhizobium sp. 134]|uniref:response regulator transcription factor n=1 Tax=unclassified Bradyrhizobium TaxID=2631580 RepID=UPI001FFAD44A